MQTLTDSYLVELAKQMAFLGAFLGGFAATFLATLLVVDSSKRMADWASVLQHSLPAASSLPSWPRS